MSDFVKTDNGKPRLDLLPPVAVDLMGQVLAYGAAKYAPNNWRRVDKRGRYVAATLRHLFAWMGGERVDAESRLPHLAHALTSLAFLAESDALGLGEDDRGCARIDGKDGEG